MKSVQTTQHTFSQSPAAEIPRSVFNRGHGHKTTFGITDFANALIPIYVDEMVPGDTFTLRLHAFCRLIPVIVPFMDNLYMDFFFFAVPNRLLWANWKKFMGEQANPGDSTSYVLPVITTPAGGYQQTSMAGHFGLPIGVNSMPNVSALPFRAYNLIWNEWFRDQNLQNSAYINTGDGPDTFGANYPIQPRGKRHDYFTSCLPLPQKAAAVNFLAGMQANVKGIGSADQVFGNSTITAYESGGGSRSYAHYRRSDVANADNYLLLEGTAAAAGYPTIYADLGTAVTATINSLRQSFQIQKLYERDNRGGTRYTEVIRSHFGVTSPDARLQRPEYLGGGSVPMIINPVTQTSVTAATPQGNLAGYGTMASSGNIGFTYSATEHMTLIGLCAARADLTYQQGIERMWSRSTRLDFYWPALSHLGEQSVLNQEIYSDGTGNDALTFGYQERYAEYRYKPSKITNGFNSYVATPLDMWHLAQKFTSLPALNSTFISSGPPLSRVVAVTSTDPVLCDFYFDLRCARPMPVYSVPGLVDHF